MHPSLERYVDYLHKKGRTPGTLKVIRQDVGGFISWWEAKCKRPYDPQLVRMEDVREWGSTAQQAGKAVSTINRRLAVLRSYWNWAVNTGLVVSNPAQDVKAMPTQALAPRSLPPEGIDALLREVLVEPNVAQRLRNQAILVLLIYTGLRVQEVCDLQLRDVDLAASTVLVRHGKGNKVRRVPLHKDAHYWIEAYLDQVRCPQARPPLGSLAETEPLLAGRDMSQSGQPFKPGIDQRLVQRLVRTLGERAARRLEEVARGEANEVRAAFMLFLAQRLSTVTPHMLRHSLAKRLLESGAKLTEVQRVLGHTRLDTTAQYLTPSEDDLRLAISKVNY